jgi:hypothetical protein
MKIVEEVYFGSFDKSLILECLDEENDVVDG